MGTNKLTTLKAGTAAADAIRLDQLQAGNGITLGTVAGTNTITAVASPVISAYAAGQVFIFTPAATNTGATTLNIDSKGAKNVYLYNRVCDGGELIIACPAMVVYDGTQFQILGTGAILPRKYVGLPVNSQSAAYTTILADAGYCILHPLADNNARTFTIDSNANVAYPIGTVIVFVNQVNTVTISITSDTLVLAGGTSTGSRTLSAYGIASALKLSATLWTISGTNLT